MEMLLTILRLIAFLLSVAGYVAFARAYLKISARASYIFVLSSLALLTYFAGLAGVLLYVATTPPPAWIGILGLLAPVPLAWLAARLAGRRDGAPTAP